MARDVDGRRLNIRKADLRSWRMQFAENLRELGVTANATERAVRGLSRTRKKDGIYRAAKRGDSTHLRERRSRLSKELVAGQAQSEPGADTVKRTWAKVREGWTLVASKLRATGDHERAEGIGDFLKIVSSPVTEKERLIGDLREAARSQRGVDHDPTR